MQIYNFPGLQKNKCISEKLTLGAGPREEKEEEKNTFETSVRNKRKHVIKSQYYTS